MNKAQAFIAMLKQFQFLLIAVGVVLVHLGLDHSVYYKYLEVASGSVVALGTAAWGFWSTIQNFRQAQAVGVQAGINLTVAGKALDSQGDVISRFGADAASTPPKPVTQATAATIVKEFAPAEIPPKS